MTLLIDVGNSAVKWGWLDRDGLSGCARQLHRGVDDLSERLAAQWSKRQFGEAFGCSVASATVTANVEAAVRASGASRVRWWSAEALHRGAFELINGYQVPGQLGTDRWHAMLGAVASRSEESLLVVNAGTATTVDCVLATAARSARFIGGVIAPGLRLMRESLASGAAGLPLAEGKDMPFPDHTAAAIVTGVADASAGLVERVYRRFAQAHAVEPTVMLAGGSADALAATLPSGLRAVIEHNLVLLGVAARLHR